jgi:hypothetical protein
LMDWRIDKNRQTENGQFIDHRIRPRIKDVTPFFVENGDSWVRSNEMAHKSDNTLANLSFICLKGHSQESQTIDDTDCQWCKSRKLSRTRHIKWRLGSTTFCIRIISAHGMKWHVITFHCNDFRIKTVIWQRYQFIWVETGSLLFMSWMKSPLQSKQVELRRLFRTTMKRGLRLIQGQAIGNKGETRRSSAWLNVTDMEFFWRCAHLAMTNWPI